MAHFRNQDGFNAFRLPVGWQFLVNNNVGGNLFPANLVKYDSLVRACLATGAYCIIDIHNYARWNGQIIGQGGPANGKFTSLWSQLAQKYARETKVVMGLMNEPHDVNINRWAETVQEAVTAIRKAGATSHYILLPGNGYTNAGQFATGSAPALSRVANLDGSKTNLIFDVHQYFDGDNSGTSPRCVSDKIDAAFAPLAAYLRKNKRLALLSETGGGKSDPSCLTNVCKALSYLDNNSDVYLGYLGWSAGSFDSQYVLSLSPNGNTDVPLISNCFGSRSGKANQSPQPPLAQKAAGNSNGQSPGTPPAGNGKVRPAGRPPARNGKVRPPGKPQARKGKVRRPGKPQL
ncbi:Endoglucanase EG-II [Pseudocyphellaria aurata]|nr:Endoglucanase EG-II [Pseudocyphellaria aurata]